MFEITIEHCREGSSGAVVFSSSSGRFQSRGLTGRKTVAIITLKMLGGVVHRNSSRTRGRLKYLFCPAFEGE